MIWAVLKIAVADSRKKYAPLSADEMAERLAAYRDARREGMESDKEG